MTSDAMYELQIKVPLLIEPDVSWDIAGAVSRATHSLLPLGRRRSYRFGRDLGLSRRAAFWMARHPGTWEIAGGRHE